MKRQQGGELVEFSLIMIPMFGVLFLIIDLSWMLFARATLQYAVREGVRYAVTGQTMTGTVRTPPSAPWCNRTRWAFLGARPVRLKSPLPTSTPTPTWPPPPATPAATWCRYRRPASTSFPWRRYFIAAVR